jgi:hypothetical protein
MFHKMQAAPETAVALEQPKVAFFASFRRAPKVERPAASDDTFDMTPSPSFESFGRGGLQLDGLHRDVQWVGAWGGRC